MPQLTGDSRGGIWGLSFLATVSLSERRNACMLARAVVAAFALALLCLSPKVSQAQTLDQDELKQTGLAGAPKDDWNATLGVGLAVEPRYLGAKDYRVSPVPLVSVSYRDLLFVGPQGVGVNVVRWGGFRAGPVLGFGYGRPQSRDSHLNGLGDIPPGLEGGGFISYTAGPFRVTASVRQAITHTEKGLNGRLALDYRQPLIPKKLILAVGPELDFGDGQYARTWFGVSSSQSVTSGLPTYRPDGGLRDVGLNGSLTYELTEHVFLRTFVDGRRLVGEMSDSPIVQQKGQVLVGFGAAYHF